MAADCHLMIAIAMAIIRCSCKIERMYVDNDIVFREYVTSSLWDLRISQNQIHVCTML